MKQPELGKKIVELRKRKGLTQEELVEKCNLSVRTIQRIESGEVIPRSYTVRLVFAALDYTLMDSSENEISRRDLIVFLWLGQFYEYFLDLFNFKTNKMRKIAILSIMFSAVVLGIFGLITEIKAQKDAGTNIQSVDTNSSKQKGKEIVLSNSSCENCFNEGDIMIGRGVRFTNNGVNVSFKLLKFDKKSREFNAGYIRGKILLRKVEVTCAQDNLIDGYIKYSADKTEKTEDIVTLKGKAKLTSIEGDYIEAEEIVITTI
jgi:transcriptional regulator with XRE-family HTH domain